MWYSSVQETQNRNTKKSQKMWQCFLYILVQNEVVFPFVQKRSQRHPHFWQKTHSPVFRCSAWLRSLFQMYTCNDATIATFLGCIFYSGKNSEIYIKLHKYARCVRNMFCRFLSTPDWPICHHHPLGSGTHLQPCFDTNGDTFMWKTKKYQNYTYSHFLTNLTKCFPCHHWHWLW